MSHISDLVQIAGEQAENIKELPEQLRASFTKENSAEGRLGFIRSKCNRIRIGLMPVTNYIERNQPHLYREYLRRIELLLDGIQKCAIREIPEYSKTASKGDSPSGGAQETAELAVVAMVLAAWLRQWAEELSTKAPSLPIPEVNYGGFVPADTLWISHGIRQSRLCEAKKKGLVKTKPAPPGIKDSQGKGVRVFYNQSQAIQHCKPKKLKPKKLKRQRTKN